MRPVSQEHNYSEMRYSSSYVSTADNLGHGNIGCDNYVATTL